MYLDEDIQDATAPMQLSDKEVFTRIWLTPRRVFQFIDENSYEKYNYLILIFAGAVRGINEVVARNVDGNKSMFEVLLIGVLIGGAVGWFSYFLFAILLSWTGKWLNGSRSADDVFRVLTYALLPVAVSLVLMVLLMVLMGDKYHVGVFDFKSLEWSDKLMFAFVSLINAALLLWSFVLMIVALSVVQKYSYGKAFLNLVLPLLVVFVPLILLVVLLSM